MHSSAWLRHAPRRLFSDNPSTAALTSSPTSSSVLSPEAAQALSQELLGYTAAETMTVSITHKAVGIARVARGRVRLNNSGDTLEIALYTAFGRRASARLTLNQMDSTTLRQCVHYLDALAREQEGDPAPVSMPIPPRTYLPNSSWHETTSHAFSHERHTVIPALIEPLIQSNLVATASAGVYLCTRAHADKEGLLASGQESDSELVVTGWNVNGKGSGWAGQAERDWTRLEPEIVGQESLRLTRLAANPVAFEPGHYTAILDRPAVAQIVRGMGVAFHAKWTIEGGTPLSDTAPGKTKIGRKVMDERVTLTSHPNDPDGGYLPFNDNGYPLIAMPWIEAGVAKNLAYSTYYAAAHGVTPANDVPESMRLQASGRESTVDEMIANCELGIYVNRLANVAGGAGRSGMMTGVTSGGCFLVRNGKIVKSIKDLRFLDSPWFFLNRLVAVGRAQRSAFGYAPWYGEWPIAPTIAPPIMVKELNFVALADAV